MNIGIIGTKIGMTQIFGENGEVVPVTVIKAEPNTVTGIRTLDKNGYAAVQLGIGEKKKSRVTKPVAGQYAKIKEENGVDIPVKRKIKEFRLNDAGSYEIGGSVQVDMFEVGERVDVTGVSKGKGFQGVMKRHNFAGGPGGHGSQFHRAPGSVGQCAWPSRIFKGKKMPGRMGGEQVTVKGLKVVGVDVENSRILVCGAVPGGKRGVVYIKKKKA
jgi:large subunit ribosomal protein L3